VPRPSPRSPLTSAPGGSGLSRRALLAGGAGTLLLAACGSSSPNSAPAATDATKGRSLLAFFDASGDTGGFLTTGSRQRAPFGLAAPDGSLLSATPAALDFTVTAPDGSTRAYRVPRRNEGLPRSYYAVEFTPQHTGNYEARTTFEGAALSAAFTVMRPGQDPTPRPGSAMPAIATPTQAAPRGVTPICTRDPECPFHTTSLDAALKLGRPTAFLVATPKFCQVAICGPVLDVMVSLRERYADRITMIHQEVYKSATEAAEKGANAALAPALDVLRLGYEPALFLVQPDGRIQQRIDFIFDQVDLRQAFDRLVA
jgi:hypothetical protein